MPTIRNARKETVSVVLPLPSSPHFEFPGHRHLLITTPKLILAWELTGIHTVFQSRRGSIVAAREAKDESGVLAVAGRNVLIMHDTKRKQQRSWGLPENEGQICHLEYSPDARSLYYSTALTDSVEHYSVEHSRLLSPVQSHASSVVALALSPTGSHLLSASRHPPVMFLTNIAANQPPLLIEPTASSAEVVAGSFHPEKPNIFVVAFRDGTVAAYDTTSLPKRGLDSRSDQAMINNCEISHFQNLHHSTGHSISDLHRASAVAPVTGVAFLPGSKTRAVTVGSDGRCKLVDFAHGGKVLRTWHAAAALTTISISGNLGEKVLQQAATQGQCLEDVFQPHTTHVDCTSLIAVGCADGRVQIYSPIGLLLAERNINCRDETILGVEWVDGPAPRSLYFSDEAQLSGKSTTLSLGYASSKLTTPIKPDRSQNVEQIPQKSESCATSRSPISRRTSEVVVIPTSSVVRKFAVHPDEVEDGTVRHTPLTRNSKAGPGSELISGYHDLFSPVKAWKNTAEDDTKHRVLSPPRNRPRISSKTFVKTPAPLPALGDNSVGKPRNLALFPSTDSKSSNSISPKDQRCGATNLSRVQSGQTTQVTPHSRRPSHTMIKPAVTFESDIWQKGRDKEQISAAASSQRLQAGLRESNRIATTEVNRNLLLPNAIPIEKANLQQKQRHNTKGAFHLQPNTLHPSFRPRPVHVNQRDTWPTDSVTSTSFSDVVGDVWVTSDSDTEPNPYRKPQRRNSTPLKSRLLSQPQQKQEQTSRSMPRNTARHLANAVTTADNIYGPPRPVLFPTPLHADESTDEAMSATADTRLSPDETFSPASEDVRELFPRSSSLSPRKKAKQRQRNRPVHRGSGVYRSREGAPAFDEKLTNTDMARRSSKSPWTRAKAERLGSLGQETQALQFARPETREAFVQCTNCSDSGERLRNLEAEVAQLRDDVLALNTAIRRSGLPFLACLR